MEQSDLKRSFYCRVEESIPWNDVPEAETKRVALAVKRAWQSIAGRFTTEKDVLSVADAVGAAAEALLTPLATPKRKKREKHPQLLIKL